MDKPQMEGLEGQELDSMVPHHADEGASRGVTIFVVVRVIYSLREAKFLLLQ